MNKNVLTTALIVAASVMSVHAQNYQQINNQGFEVFEAEGTNSIEPQYWNSFDTAEGNLAGSAKGKAVDKVTDKRPGTSGNYSVKIWSRQLSFLGGIIKVTANGNLTTGRMVAGDMNATSTKNNNTTKRNVVGFNYPFTVVPDSITIWAKYVPKNPADYARISAIIHDDNDTQDPGANAAQVVATAALNYQATADKGWKRISIPFVKGASSNPRYILVSLTTNKTPGEGSVGDEVYFDDVCMVYNGNIGVEQLSKTNYKQGESISVIYSNPVPMPNNLLSVPTVVLEMSDASGNFANATEIASNSNLTSGTLTGNIPMGQAVGSGYKMRVRTKGYSRSTDLAQTITIEQAEVATAISIDAISAKTYGDDAFSFTVNTNNNQAALQYSFSNTNVVTVENGKLKILNAGETTMTVSQAQGNGFTAGSASTTVRVNPATLTVTAKNTARVYGAANPTFEYTVSGLKYSDNNAVITTAPIMTCAANATSVGQAAIVISGGQANGNYTLSYVNGTLTINPKTITISMAAVGNKIYGDEIALPQVTTENTETEVVYSVEDINVAVIVNGKLQMVGAGTTNLLANQAASQKYNAATTKTAIQVNPATLTITAKDAEREQGEANPTFEYTISGLKFEDTRSVITEEPLITCLANETTPVGSAPIEVSGGKANKNYTLAYENGVLTIKKATSDVDIVRNANIYYSAPILYLKEEVKEVIVSGVNGALVYRVTNPSTAVDLGTLADGKYLITIITSENKPYSFMIKK